MLFKNLLCLLVVFRYIQGELQLVIEIFRHGSRYPITDYEFWDSKMQIKHSGELSPTGMRQHYILGQTLRKEYIENLKYLSPQYNNSELYVQSTGFNRTIISALSQLQGLYPEFTGPQIPSNIPPYMRVSPYFNETDQMPDSLAALPHQIQLIPVHNNPLDQERLLYPILVCKKFDYDPLLMSWIKKNPEITQLINNKYEHIFSILSTIRGEKIDFSNFETAYDVLIADLYNNNQLPQNLDSGFWEKMHQLSSMVWTAMFYDPQIIRMMNNYFIKNLFKYFDDKIQGNLNPMLKWVMYSTHDTNIANLQIALNFNSMQCLLDTYIYEITNKYFQCVLRPEFASSIIFELHKNEQQQYLIKIKLNGVYMGICGDKLECEFQEFKNRLNWIIMSDDEWNQFCGINSNEIFEKKKCQTQSKSGGVWMVIGIVQTAVLSIISFIFFIFIARRKYLGIQQKEKNRKIKENEV